MFSTSRKFHFLLFFVLPLLFSYRPLPAPMTVVIEDSSELYLNGSSNVNEFSCVCLCYEKNQPKTFSVEPEDRTAIQFDQAILKLQTNLLDCGHRGMNKDLYKTLESERHPHILIEVLRAQPKTGKIFVTGNQWQDIEATTAITLAGVRREVQMEVRGKKLDDGKYRFVSEKDLFMSDFKIDPPKPLFGLIKVDDRIRINFDLVVKVVNADF